MNPESSQPGGIAVIHTLRSVIERIDLPRLFSRGLPLEIELGSGDGSFLSQYAAAHPERNFIGVERLLGRLRKLERKCRRLGLENVRAVRIEAAYFLEYLLPANSARAIHVYFPDPWPKRKHQRHRLINARFIELARTALVDGGVIYLRTDDADYFGRMRTSFGAANCFEPVATPEELASVRTDFERGFQARGVETLGAAYRLITHQ